MMDFQQLRQRIAELDGGELTGAPCASPYWVVFPATCSRTFVYTTKYHAASQLLGADDSVVNVGVIGRYGLPRDEEIAGIAKIVSDYSICFLGDCDPFDLLVFAWLRQHFPIRYLGVSDAVVSALGVVVNERITIPLPEEERRAMSLVREVWPDFAESVGPECAQLLDGNRKLELEALVSYRTNPRGQLLGLMDACA